jgi:hypothetical protein
MQYLKPLILLVCSLVLVAEANDDDTVVSLSKMNISGPRFGLTGVSPYGGGTFAQQLKQHGIHDVYSEFGWHFELKIAPEGNTPSFVLEFIPLIGAVEYATPIPSVTMPMGIRLPNGFEFGIGPNVVLGFPSLTSSIVLAVGKTFNYRGIGIPVNVALASGKGGYALSCLAGYALVKRKRKVEPTVSSTFSGDNEIQGARKDLGNDSTGMKSDPGMAAAVDSSGIWKAHFVDSLQQSEEHQRRKHKLIGGVIASGAATVTALVLCLLPK